MEKYRAIPEGYMRIGEVAKKAGVTVRTLQYYDKEGLLSPSAESDGGFRLYTEKDIIKLSQILTMKQLGFGLAEIKKRLTSLDTPEDVLKVLTEHTTQIRGRIRRLSESLYEIEALKTEVQHMDKIDFKKIAEILVSLQMKDTEYLMKMHFENDVVGMLGDDMSREKAVAMTSVMQDLFLKAIKLHEENTAPESEKGQKFAKEFWTTLTEVTEGDFNIIQKLNDRLMKVFGSDEKWDESFITIHCFIQAALKVYFGNMYGLSEGGAE